MTDFKNMRCAADKSYPPICITGQNRCYGSMMLEDLAGAHSEMTTISMYLYNIIRTGEDCEELSALFMRINIVEMHHLKIFGSLAMALGEDPRLWSGRSGCRDYWTPAYSQYPASLCSMVHNSLSGELCAIQTYEQQLAEIEDACIKANLARIILDEQIHVEILEKVIEEYRL